ncbi:protein-tyrosine-phosphatase [Nocardia sp. SYP-A9097]|uniref:tyrosine-protein phosphatase n=1 Tax=Nocardia sp. SYP-A9097 TaxID=2663237 RepID=UPI00129BFBA1|nr:tyrosine-protein phosphatase [Nocardia sp. SYP-A9097]MRH89117.1 protein-tyrosine-phosphatase [Nocardia sp. SYP-A9097]
MTISRAIRGTVTGVAAALIAVFPVAMTPASAAPIAILHQAPVGADFKLQAAPNARDIGGVGAQNGKIKSGLVFRTDALNRLTDADQSTLTAAGITKIIDFRSPAERAASPDKVPASISTMTLPIYNPDQDFYAYIGGLIQAGPDAQQAALGDGKAAQYMRDYYKWVVNDPTSRAQFGTALKEIATTSGGVLFHCTAGKDRTGMMTAFLMSILGTPQDQIFGNFLLSNDRLAGSTKATLDALVAQGLIKDRTLFEPVLGVQKDYLESAFSQAVASFGAVNDFISQGLGIDAQTYKLLQDKLIEKGGVATGSFGS